MKILNLITIAVLVACAGSLSAQITVNMADTNSVVIDCGAGTEYQHPFSHAGSGGAYAANVNDTVTVCPDAINGSKVTVRLTSDQDTWTVHESDSLYIYDGPDTGSPLVGAFNAATDTNGIVYTASIDNPSGCLTFVFISDGADEAAFSGLLFCGYPCQPFTPYIASDPPTDPGFPDTGYIEICQGDTVWMWAQAEFPHSSANGGIGYLQDLSNSSFFWELADGTTFSGMDTVMVTPSIGAGYGVQLVVTDTFGCPQAGFNKIRVGTTPSFAGVTELTDDSICFNDTTFILGGISFDDNDTVGVEPNPGYFLNGGTFTGLTYLPDGNGVEYETTIEITGFDSAQVIAEASDILEVCLTIEHSFLGDLEMSLTCPDGTEIVMFNSWTGEGINPSFAGGFGGGGTYLGDALDGGLGTPGIGWEYCFGESAIWGTMDEEFGLGNTSPTTLSPGNAMSSGTYQPEESYTSFVGCPINGDWTITVRDNIGIDDGYIFEWGILFNPEVDPNVESYEMEVDTTWWSPSSNIIEFYGDTMIEVAPPGVGIFPFTFNVVDNFGCSHDTTINIVVDPPLAGNFGVDSVCSLEYALIAADTSIFGGWAWEAPNVPGGQITWSPDSLTGNVDIEVNLSGRYFFSFESACGQVDTLEVLMEIPPEPIVWQDTVVCKGDAVLLDAGNAGLEVDYDWSLGNTQEQTLNVVVFDQTTTVTVDVSSDCGTESETIVISVNEIGVSSDDTQCGESTMLAAATNLFSDGVWTYNTATGGTAQFDDNAALNPGIDADQYGLYEFIYSDDLCDDKDTVEIMFLPIPQDVTWDDEILCAGETFQLNAENELDWVEYNWTPSTLEGQIIEASVPSTSSISVEISNECGTATGEVEIQVNTISAAADAIGCDLTQPLIGTNFYDLPGEWSYTTQTGGSATFNSSNATLSPDVEVSEYGVYEFTYTEEQCGYQETAMVEFFPEPEISPLMDSMICIKDTISFDAGDHYGVSTIDWDFNPEPGSGYSAFQSSEQVVMADNPGVYSVTATGPCGVNDSIVTLEEFDCTLVIPSIFGPGMTATDNLYFQIENLQFHPGNTMEIYNRWGFKVFEQTEYQNQPWYGFDQTSGVFFYILTLPQIGEVKTGYVHLLSSNN
ncbi:MAG: subtilisin-like proprotein convertase family protein [Bacteroidia bacterium]|jgi:subtilisin-like proprotein convertase family protein